MTKYALLTSILVLAGCVTNPEKPTIAPPAATTTPATTAGEITKIESRSGAKRTPDSNSAARHPDPPRNGAAHGQRTPVNAETVKNEEPGSTETPAISVRSLLGPAWLEQIASARTHTQVNAGLASTFAKGCPSDIGADRLTPARACWARKGAVRTRERPRR